MRGYLLDTNHVEAFFSQDATIIQKIRTVPADHLIWVCSITLGEIDAGHSMTQTTNQTRRDEYIKFVNEEFVSGGFILNVSEYTREYYAKIMGKIWENHPPSKHKVKTEQHLISLGVDINDVWNVAVAWEHGLTFLTNDGMACIKGAVGTNVEFDNWIKS